MTSNYNKRQQYGHLGLHVFEKVYLVGFMAVFIYSEVLHWVLFANSLEFLPLMMISTYSSVGLIYSWLKFYLFTLVINNEAEK